MADDRNLGDLPFGVGAAAGAGAWILTYLFTYIITSSEIQNSIIGRFTDIPTWKAVGWVFYNAHFANTIVDVPIVGGATNFIGGENGFTPLLYVIPPLLLLVAGLAVGRYYGATDDTAGAAMAGVTTVVGYGVLSIVGVFLFAMQEPSIGTDPITGILLAGIVYPAVFGTVGAVAAGLTAGGSRPESTTRRL
jgi:hypothetical protein